MRRSNFIFFEIEVFINLLFPNHKINILIYFYTRSNNYRFSVLLSSVILSLSYESKYKKMCNKVKVPKVTVIESFILILQFYLATIAIFIY